MLNYEHETKDIGDRYLKYFIFNDYFHDSIIHNITICDEGKQLIIELSCEREWPSHDWNKYMLDSKYMYKLIFKDCKHIEYQRSNFGKVVEYINGRFKNSAKLFHIGAETRKKHYHLRIQLAGGGFLDLIFRKIIIEKIEGIIELPYRIALNWHFDWILKKFNNYNVNEIRGIAECGDFPLKTLALEYLWHIRDVTCYDLSIKALNDEDAWIVTVFIIGELGNLDIMPLLVETISNTGYESLTYRHINDAIEKIILRESKKTIKVSL
jgi:hypothetical protein